MLPIHQSVISYSSYRGLVGQEEANAAFGLVGPLKTRLERDVPEPLGEAAQQAGRVVLSPGDQPGVGRRLLSGGDPRRLNPVLRETARLSLIYCLLFAVGLGVQGIV